MDSVFRPGIDTSLSPTTFEHFSMEGSVENPIVLEEEEDKENAPPPAPSHQHPCLSDPRNLPGCKEAVLLEQE